MDESPLAKEWNFGTSILISGGASVILNGEIVNPSKRVLISESLIPLV